MAWFKAFRNEYGYAYYGEQRLPVILDVPLTVVIYVCLCISIAFLIAAAGIKGKERCDALIRLVYSLLIGSVILVNGPATELYHALDRGLPHVILMVLEHFDINEGGLRIGRSCKIAGHFAGILLWTAFAFWIALNIILCSVVCNGAVCFIASGVSMVLAIVAYHHLNLSLGFRLPGFQGEMHLRYGWFLLSTLVLGIITTLFGILLILTDYKYPQKVAAFLFLETALEFHHEGSTYRYPIPVVDNDKTGTYYAPQVQDNKNNEKRLTTTLNRYLNYGFKCSPNKKKSPFFGGSDSDLSTINESDGAFSPGRRFPE